MKHCSQSLSQLNLTTLLPNNPNRFHIIFIGAGSIVNLGHLPAYELPNFTVKVISDIDQKRAQETATKWNIPNVFTTLTEACEFTSDEKIIFDIAVPSKQIISVLEKLLINSYALIQKPMGECLSEAQAIVDLCEQRHIHGSINFRLRYAPCILALKDAIRRSWLGDKITTIEIHVNVLMPWSSWPFLASAPRLELVYHSVHYVDLVRDLMSPYEPTDIHCRTSRHAAMPHLSPVRSSLSLEFEHDPFLYVNIYTNHHHRWRPKQAQSYLLIEGTGGAAKAQIEDNLAYGENIEGKQTDYLQICSDEMTQGEWVDIDLQGRSRFPHAFIGSMAAVMREHENENELPSTIVQNTLKTMAVLEAACHSSTQNMTRIQHIHN